MTKTTVLVVVGLFLLGSGIAAYRAEKVTKPLFNYLAVIGIGLGLFALASLASPDWRTHLYPLTIIVVGSLVVPMAGMLNTLIGGVLIGVGGYSLYDAVPPEVKDSFRTFWDTIWMIGEVAMSTILAMFVLLLSALGVDL